jgi:NitT/TauT family transport system substrate-binding protein
MMMSLTRRASIAVAAAATGLAGRRVRADEATKLRISHGYSVGYLPLMIMRDRGLIEKHAAQIGPGKLTVEWQVLDGGNNINDAMLAGALDIAAIGIPGFLVLRDRTLGRRQEMIGISALDSGALWLNTINPRIKTLADYTSNDRIAVPGIKTSYAAVVLEMVVAKQFGIENYAKLDPMTVGLPHPEAYAVMMGGKTEITSHVASPPFSYQELRNPAVHRVLSTSEVLGPLSILLTMTQRQFADANPGLIRAFLAAQEEANGLIDTDREGAVTAYIKATQLKMPRDELLQILADPENAHSTTPHGSETYASFLAQTGVIKSKPAAWTDLFLPVLHDRKGS